MKHSFATLDQLLVSLFLDQKFSICFWYLKIILYDFYNLLGKYTDFIGSESAKFDTLGTSCIN